MVCSWMLSWAHSCTYCRSQENSLWSFQWAIVLEEWCLTGLQYRSIWRHLYRAVREVFKRYFSEVGVSNCVVPIVLYMLFHYTKKNCKCLKCPRSLKGSCLSSRLDHRLLQNGWPYGLGTGVYKAASLCIFRSPSIENDLGEWSWRRWSNYLGIWRSDDVAETWMSSNGRIKRGSRYETLICNWSLPIASRSIPHLSKCKKCIVSTLCACVPHKLHILPRRDIGIASPPPFDSLKVPLWWGFSHVPAKYALPLDPPCIIATVLPATPAHGCKRHHVIWRSLRLLNAAAFPFPVEYRLQWGLAHGWFVCLSGLPCTLGSSNDMVIGMVFWDRAAFLKCLVGNNERESKKSSSSSWDQVEILFESDFWVDSDQWL